MTPINAANSSSNLPINGAAKAGKSAVPQAGDANAAAPDNADRFSAALAALLGQFAMNPSADPLADKAPANATDAPGNAPIDFNAIAATLSAMTGIVVEPARLPANSNPNAALNEKLAARSTTSVDATDKPFAAKDAATDPALAKPEAAVSATAAMQLGAAKSQAERGDSQALSETKTYQAVAEQINPDANAASNNLAALAGKADAVPLAAVASRAIEAPISSPAWGAQVVNSVRHFVQEKIQVAELRLNPQELGPIRVEIAMDQGAVAIHFSASREEVRQALGQHLNQLQQSLSDSGVSLQSATTGSFADNQAFSFMQQQSQSRGNGGSNGRNSTGFAAEQTSIANVVPTVQPNRPTPDGAVDLFA